MIPEPLGGCSYTNSNHDSLRCRLPNHQPSENSSEPQDLRRMLPGDTSYPQVNISLIDSIVCF